MDVGPSSHIMNNVIFHGVNRPLMSKGQTRIISPKMTSFNSLRDSLGLLHAIQCKGSLESSFVVLNCVEHVCICCGIWWWPKIKLQLSKCQEKYII